MKLVSKNNYKFAAGMFWQVPDEGKRSVNLAKLIKDTKYDMMCQTKTIKPTWGFCRKDELQGEKKVASLGKFIIEASQLSVNYSNSIICYKFKNTGELDDNGKALNEDLFGYIVLLNGTICPDEGEYVANFELIYESIISQAKKYEIETLYMPLDVALRFFSIFEVLSDNLHNDEQLSKIIQNLTNIQKNELNNLIDNDLNHKGYRYLLNTFESTDIDLLRSFISEEEFEKKLKTTKEANLKYLIQTVYTLPLVSDEIYWNNKKYKQIYKNSLIEPISKKTTQKYKIGALLGLVGVSTYLFYVTFVFKEPLLVKPKPAPMVPHPTAVAPIQLVNACLVGNDRFFTDLKNWLLIGIKCNSLGATLTFDTDTDPTIDQFIQLVGTDNNIKLSGRSGTYTIKYKLNSVQNGIVLSKEHVLNSLQQAAINNGLKLNIQQTNANLNDKNMITKFNITSKQSPIYLINNGILDNVKLREINASLDKASGFYNWTLQGEF